MPILLYGRRANARCKLGAEGGGWARALCQAMLSLLVSARIELRVETK
ncbi:MAG TPA: hypothetical protein VK388_03125 [Pyrinomonadaceae bacterium]|nr:hypothetical protein [Pyrinomonadaceae bacterium]